MRRTLNRQIYLEAHLADNNIAVYKTIQNQIEQIEKEYTNGAYIRSKAKAGEETEQNISYFKAEEKKNYNIRYIRTLIKDDNTELTNPTEILKEEEQFYRKLYTKPEKQLVDETLLKNGEIPKLTKQDLEICDAPSTLDEIAKTLKELPNNKTPGTDGLTGEFYKFFLAKHQRHFI